MGKTAIILLSVLLAAIYFSGEKAFAQKDAVKSEESIEALEATEANIIESSPIQAPVALASEVREERAVDEDS